MLHIINNVYIYAYCRNDKNRHICDVQKIYIYYVFLYTYSDMDRPKRMVPKPVRYQTTSSDESPRKQRRTTAEATITGPDVINEDIADINRELNNQSPTNSITNTCLRQPHTQQYTSQCTNTNIQTHSTFQLIQDIHQKG